MAGTSWLVDSKRIATKIKSASCTYEAEVKWKSNPTRSCPSCKYVIDNSDVVQEWPGLPRGVKFDPSDQEIIWHLLAKVGGADSEPHPFINEFIPTVDENDGICYVHPKKLPGVKQDGSVAHFFHRAVKAYSVGTRKRRKIRDGDFDVRWHKTGRTKPVNLDGSQRGCKKIMVLYMAAAAKGGKTEKTNWVMHQYHLGTEEDEKDGEYVVSKVFYQQNQLKQGDVFEGAADAVKTDPLTPTSVTPDPPRGERRVSEVDQSGEDTTTTSLCTDDPCLQFEGIECLEEDALDECDDDRHQMDPPNEQNEGQEEVGPDANGNQEESKWWDSESQHLLNSQQLAEGLALVDDLLQSQSPSRDEDGDHSRNPRPKLADYARLGAEDLKKDLEACQNLDPDPVNTDLLLDTPPSEFRLSQIEFGSQESFLAWGGKLSD